MIVGIDDDRARPLFADVVDVALAVHRVGTGTRDLLRARAAGQCNSRGACADGGNKISSVYAHARIEEAPVRWRRLLESRAFSMFLWSLLSVPAHRADSKMILVAETEELGLFLPPLRLTASRGETSCNKSFSKVGSPCSGRPSGLRRPTLP